MQMYVLIYIPAFSIVQKMFMLAVHLVFWQNYLHVCIRAPGITREQRLVEARPEIRRTEGGKRGDALT